MISAGRRNTGYVDTKGDCYVLGDGRWNKFRTGTDNITTPLKLLEKVTFITSGEHEMLFVTESGALYYSGWRDTSSFGQGEGSHGPQVIMEYGVEKAMIHFGDIAILGEDGAAYVFGINTGGAIGTATTTSVKIIDSGVADVAAGYNFSAYVMKDGSLKIIGDNSVGQHGNGNTNGVSGFTTVKIS